MINPDDLTSVDSKDHGNKSSLSTTQQHPVIDAPQARLDVVSQVDFFARHPAASSVSSSDIEVLSTTAVPHWLHGGPR